MGNELTKKDESAIAVIGKHDLGNIVKPLIREIHLLDSYVAGTTYLKDKSVLEAIQIGDTLTLQREDDNKYDKKAILVLNEEKKKLGYVPEKDNIVFARLMDAGKLLKAKIVDIQQNGNYIHIGVGIYLIDL